MALTQPECKEKLFEYLINVGTDIVHIILTADEEIIKVRIDGDEHRDKEYALEYLKPYVGFLDKNYKDAIRINTKNKDIGDIADEIIQNIQFKRVQMSLIAPRDLSEKDRSAYFTACRQEPGCEDAFREEVIENGIWNIVLNGKKKTYAIEYTATKEFCGYCSADMESSTPQIGINLLPKFQSRGIGICAVKLLMKKVCSQQEIEYFIARIDPTNKKLKI